MSANEGPRDFDEEDFYDEEYEDFFDETDEKPLAVDEFLKLSPGAKRRVLSRYSDTDAEAA